MRRAPALLLAAVLLPLPVALPVITAPQPRAHAVAPSLHTARLAVDAAVAERAVRAVRAHRPASERTLAASTQQRTQRFSTVGVTWARDGAARDVDVLVRTRTGGRWSAWHDLGGQGDTAPDSASPDSRSSGLRDGTSPLFVGPSDGVQARVVLVSGAPPRDVRVDLVDPGTSAADATVGQRNAPASTAEAAAAMPSIVTRAQWGADESLRYRNGCDGQPSYAPTVLMGFVHHTETTNDYSPDQSAAQIRGIYAYHVLSNGWCDIGYNFLVDKYGRVFEGRYGGVDRPVIGAHTGGFNYNSFAASLLGSFTSATPPAAMQTALEKLFAWRLSLTYRDPLGKSVLTAGTFSESKYAAGTKVTFNTVSGHRDADYTSCPGDVAYSLLPTFRTAIDGYLGAGLVNPTASTSRIRIGTPDTLSVTSGVLGPQSWRASVIRAADGAVVRSASGSSSSTVSLTFDGRDAKGMPIAPGQYTFRLETWNSSSTGRSWDWPFTADVTAPELVSPAPGRLDVFTNGVGGALTQQTSATGGASWAAATSLGGQLVDTASVVAYGGELSAYATQADGHVYRKTTVGGSWPDAWTFVGGNATAGPGAVVTAAGTELFIRGADGALWDLPPGASSWVSLGGGIVGAPAVASPSPDTVQVFATGTNGILYVITRTGTSWSGWTRLGGTVEGAPAAAAATGTGRTDVVARTADDQLLHLSWAAASGWSPAETVPGPIASGPAAVATAQPGDTTGGTVTVDVVAVQPDGSLGRRTLVGTTWSAWTPLLAAGAPVVPTIDDVTPTPQLAGQPVTIAGRAQPGSVVQLFAKDPTSADGANIGSTTAGADGAFSLSRALTYSTSLYVATPQGQSPAAQVPVKVKVTIDSVAYQGRDGRGRCIVRFSGGTYPYIPGAPVWIRTTSGTPVGSTTVTQFGSSGRYSSLFGLACGTSYSLFSLISGTGSDGVTYTLNGTGSPVAVRTP